MASTVAVLANSTTPKDAIEGVNLDRTRVIIDDGKNSSSYGVGNHMAGPVVVSSWVTQLNGKPANQFVVSPSLFQLSSGKTGKGTIRVVSDLPQDRESVFWLVVNTAAAGIESKKNSVSFSLGQRIKVFYRPKGLEGDTHYAAKNLTWSYEAGTLKVKNPTGLSVSISDIISSKKSERIASMVMPFSEASWKVPLGAEPQNLSFTFIDEYGGDNEVPLKLGAS